MEVNYVQTTEMGVDTKSCRRSWIRIGLSVLCFAIVYFTVSQLFGVINPFIPKPVVSTFGNDEPILTAVVAIVSYMILYVVLYLAYECFKWTRKKNPHREQVEEEGGFATKYLYNGVLSFLLGDKGAIASNEDDVEKQIGSEDLASTTELLC